MTDVAVSDERDDCHCDTCLRFDGQTTSPPQERTDSMTTTPSPAEAARRARDERRRNAWREPINARPNQPAVRTDASPESLTTLEEIQTLMRQGRIQQATAALERFATRAREQGEPVTPRSDSNESPAERARRERDERNRNAYKQPLGHTAPLARPSTPELRSDAAEARARRDERNRDAWKQPIGYTRERALAEIAAMPTGVRVAGDQ